jgi:hypothetical protein
MLAQLRAQYTRTPNDEGLQRLITEILGSSAEARKMWITEPSVWMHDDGDRWTLFVPWSKQPTAVEVVSATPMRNTDLRFTQLVPIGGHIPDGCPAVTRAHIA